MRYHGNYCGPNWSDGKYQSSVVGSLPPIDEDDATCYEHDLAYARGEDTIVADKHFVNQSTGTLTGALMRAAVRNNIFFKTMTNKTQRLRSQQQVTKITKNKGLVQTNVPAAMGFSMRGIRTQTMRKDKYGTTIQGREYAGVVTTVAAPAGYVPSLSVPLNPAYFQSAALGMHARSYELYKFRKIDVHYIPQVGTDTAGNVAMITSKNIKLPLLKSDTGSFLARALTQSNAVLGPIWRPFSTTVDCDNDFRKVDLFNNSDIQDNILEEIQVYTSGTNDATPAGVVLIDYVIEFRDPIYQPHSTIIPDKLGPSSRQIISIPISAANNSLTGANSALGGYDPGTVFRCVLNLSASTLGAGPTTSNFLQYGIQDIGSSSTSNVRFSNMELFDGMLFYALHSGDTPNQLVFYATLEAATAGNYNGVVYVRTATTAISTLVFYCTTVHASGLIATTVQ